MGVLPDIRFGLQGQQPQFRKPHNPHVPFIDPRLKALLQEVPKTELHMHLSGSTPITLIRQIMHENGADELAIRRKTRLKTIYRDLDDFLNSYYSIAYQIKTPEQFRRATRAIVQDAARENVRYMEIRSSILSKGGAQPEEIVAAIEEGIREGQAWVRQEKGYQMNVGLIVLAQRAGSAEDSLKSAKLAVEFAKKPGSLIRGFDLAGSEGQHSVWKHAAALRYVKAHGLKLTVHAGETPESEGMSGVESIKAALDLGADRIGHALQLANAPQLLNRVVDNQIPVEVCPWSNVQLSYVKDYKKHPLGTFLKKGVNASLNTDNRMLSNINLTEQLAQLYQNGVVQCWEQIKTLTLNGARGAFISARDKQQLLQNIAQEFGRIERKYRPVIDAFFCKVCKHPGQKVA